MFKKKRNTTKAKGTIDKYLLRVCQICRKTQNYKSLQVLKLSMIHSMNTKKNNIQLKDIR